MVKNRGRGRAGLLFGAVLAFGAALGIAGCGSGSTEPSAVDRSAASSDCPARFGCAETPVVFQVRNDSDEAIELRADSIHNVRGADRLSLTMTVPARSTSEAKPVYLGDDGLESSDGYVRGGYRGSWTWEIVSASQPPTLAQVNLGANEAFGDFKDLGIYEGWSQVGWPVAKWESSQEPVTLMAVQGEAPNGTPTWRAVGSYVESWDEGAAPSLTWTFSPLGP